MDRCSNSGGSSKRRERVRRERVRTGCPCQSDWFAVSLHVGGQMPHGSALKKTSSLSDQIVLHFRSPHRFEVHGAHGGLVCPAGCVPKMDMRRGAHLMQTPHQALVRERPGPNPMRFGQLADCSFVVACLALICDLIGNKG